MKTAILLSSMGGPGALDEVRPFLFHLFNDPAIIGLPSFLRYPLAKLLSKRREREAKEIYAQIGGHSPILKNTLAQARALEDRLNQTGDFRCFVGMSYSPPLIASALADIKQATPDRLIVLPMYPQYSTTTTASVIRDVEQSAARVNLSSEIIFIKRFYDQSGFLQALCENTEVEIDKAKGLGPAHIVFTAHGLPEKTIRAGDPYQRECEETAALLAGRLRLSKQKWTLAYQSRVGPLRWIGPETKAVISDLARQGRALVVVPIAFVCEHSETLVELGITYRTEAYRLGASYYGVAASVGVKDAFIQGLAEEIHKINQNG